MHSVGIVVPLKVEVVSDELIRTLVFGNYTDLPIEEIGYDLTLEGAVLGSEAGIDGLADVREVIPVIDAV